MIIPLIITTLGRLIQCQLYDTESQLMQHVVSRWFGYECVLISCIVKRHQHVITLNTIIVIQSSPFIVFLNICLMYLRFYFFRVRLLSVLRDHLFFFIPATTTNDLRLWRISIPDLIHYIVFQMIINVRCTSWCLFFH